MEGKVISKLWQYFGSDSPEEKKLFIPCTIYKALSFINGLKDKWLCIFVSYYFSQQMYTRYNY